MTRRLPLLAAILMVCGMALGCSKQSPSQPVATLEPVRRQVDVVSAEGVVAPHKSAALAFRVSGRVQQVEVQEGQSVVAGQELLRLDTRDLDQSVLQARAALESARAELAKAEAGARVEEVASAEAAVAVAQAGVTTAKLAVEIAAGNVLSAEGALADAKAGVASAEQAIIVAQGNLAAARATNSAAEARLARLRAGATEGELAIAQREIERAKSLLWAYQNQRDAIGGFDSESAEYEGARGQVASAEQAVAITQLNYEEMLKGARTEDLAISEADLAQTAAAVQTQTALVAQARASRDSAIARVTQAEANLIIAKAQQQQRSADVLSAEASARQAQSQLDLIKAGTRTEDLAVAQAGVARAEAVMADAENALADAVLRAPFDGTVGELLVEEGELVSPQATVLRFGDLTKMQIETTDLSEVDINEVKVGQKATASIDALGGKALTGAVARIGTIAGDRRGDTVYKVIIELDPIDVAELRWGMSAFVEIRTR
jgi:multidrug resistance efflux pump